MIRALGFDFPLTTPAPDGVHPLSARAPAEIGRDEQLLEIRAECEHRRAAYPEMVRKGKLRQAEADRHVAILAAIADEVALLAGIEGVDGAPAGPALDRLRARAADARIGWEDKIRELRREIALRRSIWPQRVAKGLMRRTEAGARLGRIEAIHWRYWMALDGYDAELAGLPADVARDHLREQLARRDAWLRAGDACPADQVETTIFTEDGATVVLRHTRPGPFLVRIDDAGSTVLNAAGARGLYAPATDLARRRLTQDAAAIHADACAIAELLTHASRDEAAAFDRKEAA